MEKVMNYVTGFFNELMTILMALIPVSILWTILSGGTLFGFDVIANFTAMINGFATEGFVGLIALLFVGSFFIKK
jgi:hypothetical protein